MQCAASSGESASVDCWWRHTRVLLASKWFETTPPGGGLDQLPDRFLQGKWVRQFAQGQVHKEGNDIGGFFVLSDVAAAVLYENMKTAAQYANNTNQVNPLRAPSLKYIDSGHPNVS